MPHMVIFRSAEGKAGYHQAEDLDAACRFVEDQHSAGDVSEPRIFQMTEIPIEIKTVYKVVVGTDSPTPAVSSFETPVVEAPAPEPPPLPDGFSLPLSHEALDEDALVQASIDERVPAVLGPPIDHPIPSSSNRFGLFGRSG